MMQQFMATGAQEQQIPKQIKRNLSADYKWQNVFPIVIEFQ